jgi:sugar lactone lactonase YvrE
MRVRAFVRERMGVPAAIISPPNKGVFMRIRVSPISVLMAFVFLAVPKCSLAQTPPPPAGEFIYVSTGTGGQILKIDANTGVVSVLSSPLCGDGSCDLEGMVVGPDGKIYVADPRDGSIFRMDQTSASFETVLAATCDGAGVPCTPQTPIFSGTAGRDLYFLDPGGNSSNDIFQIVGAGFVGVGGPFAAPSAVITADCASTSVNAYCQLGQGAAFDASDNLVFDDVPIIIGSIFSSPPPYGAVTDISPLAGGAIALNSNTGQVFAADASTGNIWQVPLRPTRISRLLTRLPSWRSTLRDTFSS